MRDEHHHHWVALGFLFVLVLGLVLWLTRPVVQVLVAVFGESRETPKLRAGARRGKSDVVEVDVDSGP